MDMSFVVCSQSIEGRDLERNMNIQHGEKSGHSFVFFLYYFTVYNKWTPKRWVRKGGVFRP